MSDSAIGSKAECSHAGAVVELDGADRRAGLERFGFLAHLGSVSLIPSNRDAVS